MTSQISGPFSVTQTLTSLRVLYENVTFANKFPSPLNTFSFTLKETKSSLISIIYILKIINTCKDNVKHGKKLYR